MLYEDQSSALPYKVCRSPVQALLEDRSVVLYRKHSLRSQWSHPNKLNTGDITLHCKARISNFDLTGKCCLSKFI